MLLISAHEVAIEILSQIGDHGQKNLHPIIRLVSRAMKQLNLKYIPQIKAEMFELTEQMTIALPDKVVRPIKTGKFNSDFKRLDLFELRGDVFTEGMIQGCVCDTETNTTSSVCQVHTLHGCCFGNMMYGTTCLSGHNQYIGSATWKPTNNVIYYNSHGLEVGDYVVVEYEVSGDEQAFLLPEILQEAVIQRVLQWFHQERRPQVSQYHHQQFRIELNEAKKLAETGTYEDYIRALRGSYSPFTMTMVGGKPQKEFITSDVFTPPTPNVTVPGPYSDDAEAIAAGLKVGEQYFLDSDNLWGMPYGVVKVITPQ